MFQNLLVTPITPLHKTDEVNGWENAPFQTVWPETLHHQNHHKEKKDPEIRKTIKKKPKRFRTSFTTDQLRALEKTFAKSRYIGGENRKKLAQNLQIEDKSIKIWFQNRRMKEKRDTDSCDSSTESFINAVSPPLNSFSSQVAPPIKLESLEPEADFTNISASIDSSNFGNCYNYENYLPTQYQQYAGYDVCAPPVYPNMVPSHVPASVSFQNDTTSVYPTQYYPNGGDYAAEEHQYFSTEYNQFGNDYNCIAYNTDVNY